ncbi:hypothetical protein M1439_00530 [Candidatus Marsarchaeota archaeon]|nr:hypothetical protein [Candidatus Marsarchaeota archaeon]
MPDTPINKMRQERSDIVQRISKGNAKIAEVCRELDEYYKSINPEVNAIGRNLFEKFGEGHDAQYWYMRKDPLDLLLLLRDKIWGPTITRAYNDIYESGTGSMYTALATGRIISDIEDFNAEEASKEIGFTLEQFFFGGVRDDEAKAFRAKNLTEYSNRLGSIVTLQAMRALVEAQESGKFVERVRTAAEKARNTPLMGPKGELIRDWTHGYIALVIDTTGSVVAFADYPEGRAKFLNYQVPKALRAAVLRDHASEGMRSPTDEGNIKYLESLGIARKYQYPGAQDAAPIPIDSMVRQVFMVGGATILDPQYVNDVYGTEHPAEYSELDGVNPLEPEMDMLFGKLLLYYMQNPDVPVNPVPEPSDISGIRGRKLLRNGV